MAQTAGDPSRDPLAVSNFDIRIAEPADRLPIYRMLELYQHDLSDIWDQDLDAHGEYGYALDRYWDTDGYQAFVATARGKYAAFALVNPFVRVGTHGYWMDQFCVLKKYRRHGLGQALARSVFNELPGRWEVGQMPRNHAAQAFWRKVIAEHTDGKYKEHDIRTGPWQGFVQVFECTRAP